MTEQYVPSLDDAKDVYVEATRDPVAWDLAGMDMPDESVMGEGWDRMIAQVRAEALREAYADLQAYTDSGAPFGHRPVEEFLLHRADRIEREAGLK